MKGQSLIILFISLIFILSQLLNAEETTTKGKVNFAQPFSNTHTATN